jgi:hypothetical protein
MRDMATIQQISIISPVFQRIMVKPWNSVGSDWFIAFGKPFIGCVSPKSGVQTWRICCAQLARCNSFQLLLSFNGIGGQLVTELSEVDMHKEVSGWSRQHYDHRDVRHVGDMRLFDEKLIS